MLSNHYFRRIGNDNNNQIGENKEQTIFDHKGNIIMTEDREIQIISKFEEPLIVVLGNVLLSDEECEMN